MGKKIDAFVLTLAAAVGLYFYFLGALRSKVAALAMALLCCLVLSKLARRAWALLSKGRFFQRRRVRRCASGAVMELACLSSDEARKKLEALLRAGYGEGTFSLELIQLHPSTKLPQDRLFDVWRAHRGEDRLAVCATCAADVDCHILAASLRAPRVALVDSRNLAQLIVEHPEGFSCQSSAPIKRAGLQLRRAASLLINRRNAPRELVFTLAMLLMYALSGNLAYLIASMALLFLVLASLRRAPRPAKLF